MKKGFTMIELIFVIVILGILAAVAIPKLAATRDDARIASGASDVATAVSDFGSRFTARGTWTGDRISDVTNVQFNGGVDAALAANTGYIYTSDGQVPTAVNSCITLTIDGAGATPLDDGNLTITDGLGTHAICRGMVAALNDLLTANNATGTQTFGGSSVVW